MSLKHFNNVQSFISIGYGCRLTIFNFLENKDLVMFH